MEPLTYQNMAALERRHWWFVARRRLLEVALGQLRLPAAARILELGCGTGGNLALLGRFGAVSALEPNDFARETAQTAAPAAEIRHGLLPQDIPFPDGSYDLVAMFDVLEHVPDDAGSLAAARRLARPGGRLMLTVPGYPWLWSAHDVAHHHLRRYRRTELLRLVRDAGWGEVRSSRFMTVLLPLVVLHRFIGRLTGRERGDDAMPPAWLNRLLYRVFAAERHLVGLPVPLGVSILVTARRDY